ncbi:hypothetical protein [Dermatobacter hominis]|uniref:hypothetical protein n=1 Tax=Dermatobacter hominis TaxID=2884263 RepID=UPI001D0FA9E3|nr:hypothetical protein [Dermatobacter hominis]UDY37277.1 hypothetical protein LH044_06995 [Dermatobacter hominis]
MTAVGALVVALSLVAAACTIGGPAPTDWKVKPGTIKVVDGEDNDVGDEPYVIQVGFRSKLGVAGSSAAQISSQCYAGALPAPDAAPDGTTLAVPAGSADVTFPEAQNLDIGDVLLGTAPLEIFGTLTFAMERDGIFSGCAISDALGSALVPVLNDALNLLIAGSAVPPTQEQLIDLIVANLGNFLNAVGGFLAAFIEGLGNPDDIVGVGVQILLPTAGAFTDLLNTAFAIGGIFQPGLEQGFIPISGLPSSVKIKVGSLVPSNATFDFQSDAAHYVYSSTIGH